MEPGHGDGDRETISDLLWCLAGTDQELRAAWQTLLEICTRRFVDDSWYQIQVVAEALVAKTTLTGEEVRKLVWSFPSHLFSPTIREG